jgi:hypothetical protein
MVAAGALIPQTDPKLGEERTLPHRIGFIVVFKKVVNAEGAEI